MFVLYAPNVHIGGGVVLLRALLLAWPDKLPLILFCSVRAKSTLPIPIGAKVFWVTHSISSRLNAELNLRKETSVGKCTVLCFHGLPPLLPSSARTLVFMQNRLLLDNTPLTHFKLKTRFRLALERYISYIFRQRVSEYIVQTPAMFRAVVQWYDRACSAKKIPLVRMLPFIDLMPVPVKIDIQSEWDFIYVAYGEAHKNHKNLLVAWQLLAAEGLYPTLVLTLSKHDEALMCEIEFVSEQNKLNIHNLGQLPREDVMCLYLKTKALIYPSTSESFGLPLIEATKMGLAIIAPELDYVRDVCVPVQTFDPASPLSIARAVKRFLGQPEPPIELQTPTAFWSALLSEPINLGGE